MNYLLSAMCVLAFCVMPALADEAVKSKLKVGQAAPSFTLTDHNGKTVSLADYRDKVVVLEWFNDACPFVVKHYQEGHMNQLASKYASQGVEWLLINTTKDHDTSHNKEIAGKWNISRSILDDSKGTTGKAYGATNTPHMFVINKGVLAYMGAIDNNDSEKTSDIQGAKNYVSQALDEILAGKPVSEPVTKPYGCSVKFAK